MQGIAIKQGKYFGVIYEYDKVTFGKMNVKAGTLVDGEEFLLNKNKEIVYQHTGYKDGDEYDLFKKKEALLK